MTQLKYDGKILQGIINNKEIKVTRHNDDADDLEKACMMALLQSSGFTYSDVKALYRNTKVRWKPKADEKYYYIDDCFEVKKNYNYGYHTDKLRIDSGNCFKTFKEAQTKLNQIKDTIFK